MKSPPYVLTKILPLTGVFSLLLSIAIGCSFKLNSNGEAQLNQPIDASSSQERNERMPDQKDTYTGLSDGLRLSLSVENEEWAKGEPCSVLLNLENVSNSQNEFKGVPSFSLVKQVKDKVNKNQVETGSDEYWCPIDIIKVSPLEPNKPVILHLEKGKSFTMRVDLTGFKWGRSNSSTWPSNDLFSIVPSGSYDLHFDFTIDTGKHKLRNTTEVPTAKKLQSNEVRVLLK